MGSHDTWVGMDSTPLHTPQSPFSTCMDSVAPQGNPVREADQEQQGCGPKSVYRLTQRVTGVYRVTRTPEVTGAGPAFAVPASQLPAPPVGDQGPAEASLWGIMGVSRIHLGPQLSHSTALSLSFQSCQVKGLGQKIAKILSPLTFCDLENQDPRRISKCPPTPKLFLAHSRMDSKQVPQWGPGLLERRLCLMVLAGNGFTRAELGYQHPQNGKHNRATSGFSQVHSSFQGSEGTGTEV